MLQVREKLESTKEELQDRNELLRDQYQQDAQRYRLEEQNRLYDLVQRETQKQLREIDALRERLTVPITEEEKRQTLLRILVLATYIKRHKDMVIAADRSQTLPLHALEGALRESCSNPAADWDRRQCVCAGYTDHLADEYRSHRVRLV